MKKWIEPLRRFGWLPLLALCLAIGASEGGGGVTGTGGVAYGAVTDFGSIFVNGVEYFTDTADISIDGLSGQAESRLRVGMVVKVKGLLLGGGATGQASSVEYDTDLRGTLDAAPFVGSAGIDFTVDGIAVHTDDRTIVDGALSAAHLAAGDRIEVSGLRVASTGTIAASRVALSATAGTILTGAISNVTDGTFNLGSLLVTYDASALHGLSGLSPGMVVRVRSAADPANGVLAASRIEPADAGLAAGTELSDQGVVSSLTATSFYLGGFRVNYNSDTKFKNGTSADLRNGDVVEVEGLVNADGSLAARQIAFEAFDEARVDAVVASIAADGFMLISPAGVQVTVTAKTRWRDRSDANPSSLGLATLRVGDRVSVSGQETADGVVTADLVTRFNAVPGVVLDARARGADAASIRLLSIHAVATGSTAYRDADGSALTADAFFAKVSGRRVTVNGVPSGSDVLVSSYQLDP